MVDLFSPLLIGALTIMAWSLLYKENPFYRLAESLMVGWGMGYTVYVMLTTLYQTWYRPLTGGNWTLVIPMVIGLLLFTSFHKKYVFLSRWGMAAVAGAGTGFAVRQVLPVMIFGQIGGFGVPQSGTDMFGVVNWLIVLICTVSVVIYFTFTKEHTGLLGKIATIGRWSMMIAFGATFGASLFANQVFVIERSAFLAKMPEVILIPIALILLLVDVVRRRRKA